MEPELYSPQEIQSAAPPPPPPPSTLHRIFVDSRGVIRPGWRFGLFLVLVIGIGALAGAVLKFLFHGTAQATGSLTPSQLSITEATGLFFVCIATLIMMRIERGRWGDYGLPMRNFLGKHFWEGCFGGFFSISLVLLVMYLLHGFSITGVATHGTTLVFSTVAWCFGFLIVGLSEEFSFRGYAQYTLTQGVGFWPAAIGLSALFAAAHLGNPGESRWGVLSVACFGLLFCLFLRRTGNLWWAVGFHAGWDWGQTFFYGVPDSGMLASHNFLVSAFHGPSWLTGGSVGPEASILTPLTLALAGFLFSRRHREVLYHPQTPAVAAGGAVLPTAAATNSATLT